MRQFLKNDDVSDSVILNFRTMKRLINVLIFAFAGILVLSSCEKESNSGALLIKMQADSKSYSLLKSGSAPVNSFTWDTCYIHISEIEFEAEKHESGNSGNSFEISYEWKGPRKVDLLSSGSIVGEIHLEPGEYDEISLEIQADRSASGSSPVFYLSGIYTYSDGNTKRVVIMFNENVEFEVEREGAELSSINDYTALITIYLDRLTEELTHSDLENAILTDNRIIISKDSNIALYQKLTLKIDDCNEVEFDD